MSDIWWTALTQPSWPVCEVALVTSLIVEAIGWGVMATNAIAEG